MKRYEQFNQMFSKNESAEVQALVIILAEIHAELQDNDIEFDIDSEMYKRKFAHQLDWLNGETANY